MSPCTLDEVCVIVCVKFSSVGAGTVWGEGGADCGPHFANKKKLANTKKIANIKKRCNEKKKGAMKQ